MRDQPITLFMYLASYASWGTLVRYPNGFFESCIAEDLLPNRFDDGDPPKRPCTGNANDVAVWMSDDEDVHARWLFFNRTDTRHAYSGVLYWIDRSNEPAKSRGDYNDLYITVETSSADPIVSFWRRLCMTMHPFHAFLDTERNYNQRAHEVGHDGRVTNKLTGWYSHRLPGLFAYNYYGSVYLRRWGKRPETLPGHIVTPDADGLFLVAPSGLDIEDQMTEVYSPDDLAVIQTLGPEWFHLPGQPDRGYAPTLEEFLAATPQPSLSSSPKF